MNNISEKWEYIKYKNKNTIYMISNSGRVKNIISNKILSGHLDSKGYKIFNLVIENKRYDFKAHRLVAIAFIPNPENKPEVNHIDGNKENNWDWNLEWATSAENVQHAYDTGLMENSIINKHGSKNPHSKYNENQAEMICILYYKNGIKPKEISSTLNISIDFIKSIIYANAWKHISYKYKNNKFSYKNERTIDMAKKKNTTVDDSLNYFKEIMKRASLSNYLYVNEIMISQNPKNQSIIIIPEHELWLKIVDDEEIKSQIKELDVNIPKERELNSLTVYGSDLNSKEWIDLDIDSLFAGKIIKVSIHDFDYDVPINKNLIPLKLKKSEYNNITYRIFKNNNQLVLALKKTFTFSIDNCNFTIIRLFKII